MPRDMLVTLSLVDRLLRGYIEAINLNNEIKHKYSFIHPFDKNPNELEALKDVSIIISIDDIIIYRQVITITELVIYNWRVEKKLFLQRIFSTLVYSGIANLYQVSKKLKELKDKSIEEVK